MRVCRTYLNPVALAIAFFSIGISGTGLVSELIPGISTTIESVRAEQDVYELKPGASIERGLASGGIHTYRITLTSGQYLLIVAEQRAINVVLALFGPDGQPLAKSASKFFPKPEVFSVIAESSGEYRLEVSA